METKNNEISDAAVMRGVRNLASQFHLSLVRECCRPHHGGRLIVFGKVTSITQQHPQHNVHIPESQYHLSHLRTFEVS